ncbi:unnamed protein product [Moneuplotes crassus]|uniref:Uncharacterized protein n=1 Tax=Euplotes crassus TaxID=5936 RepID=A0AAD1X9G2_EUPCR|nr:unnamed protein product [Moneuplotes crassus]
MRKIGKKIADSFGNKKVIQKFKRKPEQKQETEENKLNLRSQTLRTSPASLKSSSLNRKITTKMKLENTQNIIHEHIEENISQEKSLGDLELNETIIKNIEEEKLDHEVPLEDSPKNPIEKATHLKELFSNLSKKQSKEIEVKEENLLMDLYFHTINNSHIFDKTESKTNFKKGERTLVQSIVTRSMDYSKGMFRYQNGRKSSVKKSQFLSLNRPKIVKSRPKKIKIIKKAYQPDMAEIMESPTLNSKISNKLMKKNPNILISKSRYRLRSQNLPEFSPKQRFSSRGNSSVKPNNHDRNGLPPIHPIRKDESKHFLSKRSSNDSVRITPKSNKIFPWNRKPSNRYQIAKQKMERSRDYWISNVKTRLKSPEEIQKEYKLLRESRSAPANEEEFRFVTLEQLSISKGNRIQFFRR